MNAALTIIERGQAAVTATDLSSAQVQALSRDIKSHAAKLDEESSAAFSAALAPLAIAAEAEKSKKLGEQLAFERDRCSALVETLIERAATLLAAEEAAADEAEYWAAKAERDALARDIAKEYPAMLSTFTRLMARLEASDARVAAANAGRPVGSEWLRGAEAVARGAPDRWEVNVDVRLPKFSSARLPALTGADADAGRCWPPVRPY